MHHTFEVLGIAFTFSISVASVISCIRNLFQPDTLAGGLLTQYPEKLVEFYCQLTTLMKYVDKIPHQKRAAVQCQHLSESKITFLAT